MELDYLGGFHSWAEFHINVTFYFCSMQRHAKHESEAVFTLIGRIISNTLLSHKVADLT